MFVERTEQHLGTPTLMRPEPLVRAARWMARHYVRARDLPNALPGTTGRSRAEIRARLANAEARMEDARRAGRPEYRPARHLLLLGALLAEAAPAGAPREDQPKASGSEALRSAT